MKHLNFITWLTITVLTCMTSHADWPGFRGPNRDGVSLDNNLLQEWPEDGPKLLWTATGAGRGYSSLAIQDGKLFTMGDAPSTAADDDTAEEEYLTCFDIESGKQLWRKHIGPAWKAFGPDDWQSSRIDRFPPEVVVMR